MCMGRLHEIRVITDIELKLKFDAHHGIFLHWYVKIRPERTEEQQRSYQQIEMAWPSI